MNADDVKRAARLCELMDTSMRNRTPAQRDRQMQQWIAQAMTKEQRCKVLVSLMDFAIACKQRQASEADDSAAPLGQE